MSLEIDNTLIVTGPIDEIKRFKSECQGYPLGYDKNSDETKGLEARFCFNALVPIPKEVVDTFYEKDADDYFKRCKGELWMIENWGVRHDIYDEQQWTDFNHKDYVELCFDTNDAPLVWLRKVAFLFPKLEFALKSIDCSDFSTESVWRKGEKFWYKYTNILDIEEECDKSPNNEEIIDITNETDENLSFCENNNGDMTLGYHYKRS